MQSKTITLHLPNGVSQPKISAMINALSTLQCKVFLQRDSKRVNANSIIGVISLAMRNGDVISIIAEGANEQLAIETVESYLKG